MNDRLAASWVLVIGSVFVAYYWWQKKVALQSPPPPSIDASGSSLVGAVPSGGAHAPSGIAWGGLTNPLTGSRGFVPFDAAAQAAMSRAAGKAPYISDPETQLNQEVTQ